jgi:hypothetical protein
MRMTEREYQEEVCAIRRGVLLWVAVFLGSVSLLLATLFSLAFP